jgi:hypothetical protein
MSTFGDIERTFADLYEYRWAFLAAILVFTAAVLAFGYWRGWHLALWRHKVLVSVITVPVLAVTVWLGWSLGSPLFTNVTVEEEFPFAFNAVLPPDMERIEAEEIMAGSAKLTLEAMEAMPGVGDIFLPSGAIQGRSSGTLFMDEDEKATLEEGMEMVSGATADMNVAMIQKGIDMMKEAIEATSSAGAAQPQVVALKDGQFKDANSFHKGSGQATIYSTPDGGHLLRLEELSVTNGPALHVFLSPHEDPDSSGEVKTAGYVDLGKLKGNRGNQNYPIPADVDITAINSVVIYCKPFSVVFSVATLQDLS